MSGLMFSRLKLKHKIFAGFISVGLIATAIVVLSYGAFTHVSTNFRNFVDSSNSAQLGLLLARDVSEIQRQALIYTYEAHRSAAEQVHELYHDMSDILEQSSEHESEYIEKIREHLKAYMSTFEQLQKQKQLQHTLVYTDIRTSASNGEKHLRAYIRQISAHKDHQALLQDERILNTLLLVEKNAMRYFDSLDPRYIVEAKTSLAEVRKYLRITEAKDTSKAASDHISPAIEEIIEYERVFLEAVQRTRGYLFLVNVVMSAEAYEIIYNAKLMSKKISLEMADIEQGMFLMLQQVINAIVVAIGISLLLVVILSLLIGRSITSPIIRLTSAFKDLSKGSHQAEIPVYEVDDEIGQLTRAASIFKEKNRQTEELLDQAKELTDELTETQVKLQQDVTERINVQKEVDEIRHYLKNIIDSMPSMLVGVDAEGCVTQWNLEAERISGIGVDDATGRRLDEVIPMLSKGVEQVKVAIQKRQPEKLERLSHHVDGEHHYADVVIYPLIGNAVVGAVIRVDDITKRVRMEQLMTQTEKMMSLGGLAAGMAHELNNPLGGMLQGLQNIKRRLSPELSKNRLVATELDLDLEKVHEYVHRRDIDHFMDGMADAGHRASEIVKNMLRFSRKAEIEVHSEELASLIDHTLKLAAVDYDLKKKYDFRSIAIEREYEPGLPLVPCVASEIQQVLLNLLRNAAQSLGTQEDRTEPPRITVRTRQKDGMACIEVEDNGPGIDEATRQRVFEPFFTTRPPGVGTGLGLSVSFFIMHDEHRGSIEVESILGVGTKFIMRLPLNTHVTDKVSEQ